MKHQLSYLHLLERAVEASSNGIVITDATKFDRPIIYCNRAFEQLTGYSREEAIGQNCRFLQGVDTDRLALSHLRNALKEEQEIKIILKNYRKDQTPFWNELTISPVRDAEGNLTHFIGVQNDITQRISAEEALRTSQQQWLATFEQAAVGIVHISRKGQYLQVNQRFCSITGCRREEILDLTVQAITHPDDLQTNSQYIEDLWSGQISAYSMEQRLICKDGFTRWVNLTGSLMHNTLGEPEYVIGIVNDISDRKQAEEALKHSQLQLAQSQKLAHLGSWECEIQTGKITWSEETFRIFGMDPNQPEPTLEEHIQSIHPEEKDFWLHTIAEAIREKKFYEFDSRIIQKNGMVRHIYAQGEPVLNVNGQVAKLFGTLMDITERKQAEEELRKSEARNRALLNAIPDAMFRFSAEGIYLDCIAPKDFPLWRPIAELIGKPVLEVLPAEVAQPFLRTIAAALQNPEPQTCEYSQVIGDRSFYFELRAVAIEEAEVLAIVRDITVRKQTELELMHANEQLEVRVKERTTELQKSQEMLWCIIDNIPQAVFWKDRNSVYVGCNKSFAEVAGLSDPGDIQGKTDFDLAWQPEEAESLRNYDRWIMETDTPEYHIIEPQTASNGTQRLLDTNKIPIHDDSGNVVGIVGSFEDITERVLLAEKVRQSEELFRKIFEDAPIGIDLIDLADGYFVQVNKALCKMLDYSEADLLTKTVWEITHPEDRNKNQLVFEAAAQGEVTAYQLEKRLFTARHEVVWVNVTATMIRDAEGKPIYNLGMIENISDRKLAEAALRESESQLREQATQLQQAFEKLQHAQAKLVQTEKMSSLGQLVAGIAHEINNPVTFIQGNLSHTFHYFDDLIKLIQLYQTSCPSLPDSVRQYINEIELEYILDDLPKMLSSMRTGAERIGQIVLSLRNFARLDESEMKWVNIHEGIDNTLLILQHRLRYGKKDEIKVIKEYGVLPKFECYASLLNQVFFNIINNAIDALENKFESPTISIRTAIEMRDSLSESPSSTSASQFIVIRIADNGSGMTEEIRKRLFDPFFTTKPVGTATGLGLSIGYQIVVEKHGGVLRCVSAPKEGTEFWIEIPVRASQRHAFPDSASVVRI